MRKEEGGRMGVEWDLMSGKGRRPEGVLGGKVWSWGCGTEGRGVEGEKNRRSGEEKAGGAAGGEG